MASLQLTYHLIMREFADGEQLAGLYLRLGIAQLLLNLVRLSKRPDDHRPRISSKHCGVGLSNCVSHSLKVAELSSSSSL